MKAIKFLLFIPFIIALMSCEPIRITTNIEPFNVEPPKETPVVKKLPNEAIVLVDDTQVYSATQYSADVIHTINFPAGNLLKQALPIYFDAMFSKTRYEKNLSSLIPPDGLLIHTQISNMKFEQECCIPLVFNVSATVQFNIYDSDLLDISLPILSTGKGTISKSGLFATINQKEYGNTAYQAILNSVKNAVDAIYEAIKNPKAKISEAKQLINQDPSNIHPYRLVANLSLKQNDIAEAIAASQMYVQLAPKDPDGYLLLYKCYLAQRKYKDAIAQLEHAVSLAPRNPNLLLKLYDFYIERGKYDKAIESVNRYIEHRPDDEYAAFRLALIYFKLGKYDEVIKISEKTIDKLSFSGIGASIMKNEDEYAKIKSTEPNSPAQKAGLQRDYEIIEIDGKSTLEMKINEIIQKMRGEEGTEVKLTIRKPESNETFTTTLVRKKFYTSSVTSSFMGLIALSYLEKNNKDNAKKYIEEAEKFSSGDIYLTLARAAFYLKESQYEKALSELSSAKDIDYGKLLQAIAYAKMSKFEESLNLYRKISNSKSMLITEKSLKEFFTALLPYTEKIENRAIEYEKTGQPLRALAEYARLIEVSTPEKAQWSRSRVSRIISQNPSLVELKDEARKYFLQAEVLFTNNKFEEAIDELEKASHIQPFNPQIYFNKAIIYEKISDYAKAIENMEIYLQLNPNASNAQAIKDQIYKWRFMLEKEI